MGVDPVAPLDRASGLAGLGERGACPQEGTAGELQIPRIYSSSVGVGLSGVRCLEGTRDEA